MREFTLLNVYGSEYEIGLQVGEALKERISRSINQIFDYEINKYYKLLTKGIETPAMPTLSAKDMLARTRTFLPLFESYCPGMLEELRGIAKGAQIDFEQALLLQIRGELVYAFGGCTSFALSKDVTKDGQVIIGQNWDYNIDYLDLMHILHVTPRSGPRRLTFTFAGLTSYMGLNSCGVSQFGNALPWGWCNVAIPHYPIKWRMYQEQSLKGVRELLEKTKTVQPGNTVLADGEGNIADAEMTPERLTWLEQTEGFFVHTNHFICEPYANRSDLPPLLADSIPRFERIQSLVRESSPTIDVDTMKRILSDHQNYPVSICRHSKDIWTSASLIAEPERGIMHVCAGNPCDGHFVSYRV